MFDWLFKKKKVEDSTTNKTNFNKEKIETQYNISDEVIFILEKWNGINQTNLSISDLFSLLKLDGPDYIDIKYVDYPIYDDVWKIPGYIGSFRFEICINKDTSFHEYSKRFLDEIGDDNTVRYIVHLCKDGLVLDMDYKEKTRDFRKFSLTYKIDKENLDYKFKQVNEYSLVILEPDSVYSFVTDIIVCERFRDKDGYYNIKINERVFGEIFAKIIRFKLKNDIQFNFPKEKELMNKIGNKSVAFPENIMANLINYFKKYNIEIENIKVEGINNEEKVSRKVSYQVDGDKTDVVLNKKDETDTIETQKTINVFTEYENGYYVRVFKIKTISSKDMTLKIYYNNSLSINDRDFKVIDYFMGYFPVGLIDKSAEWYSFDIYFMLLCDFCFNDNMECIDMISLENYEYGKLVANKEWKKYNLDQTDSINDGPVLKRK